MSNFYPSLVDPVGPVNTTWHGLGSGSALADMVRAYYIGLVQQQYVKFRQSTELSALPYVRQEYVSPQIKIRYTRHYVMEMLDVYVSMTGAMDALSGKAQFAFFIHYPIYTDTSPYFRWYGDTPDDDANVYNVMRYGITSWELDTDPSLPLYGGLAYVDYPYIASRAKQFNVTLKPEDYRFFFVITQESNWDTQYEYIPNVLANFDAGRYREDYLGYWVRYPEYPQFDYYVGDSFYDSGDLLPAHYLPPQYGTAFDIFTPNTPPEMVEYYASGTIVPYALAVQAV